MAIHGTAPQSPHTNDKTLSRSMFTVDFDNSPDIKPSSGPRRSLQLQEIVESSVQVHPAEPPARDALWADPCGAWARADLVD